MKNKHEKERKKGNTDMINDKKNILDHDDQNEKKKDQEQTQESEHLKKIISASIHEEKTIDHLEMGLRVDPIHHEQQGSFYREPVLQESKSELSAEHDIEKKSFIKVDLIENDEHSHDKHYTTDHLKKESSLAEIALKETAVEKTHIHEFDEAVTHLQKDDVNQNCEGGNKNENDDIQREKLKTHDSETKTSPGYALVYCEPKKKGFWNFIKFLKGKCPATQYLIPFISGQAVFFLLLLILFPFLSPHVETYLFPSFKEFPALKSNISKISSDLNSIKLSLASNHEIFKSINSDHSQMQKKIEEMELRIKKIGEQTRALLPFDQTDETKESQMLKSMSPKMRKEKIEDGLKQINESYLIGEPFDQKLKNLMRYLTVGINSQIVQLIPISERSIKTLPNLISDLYGLRKNLKGEHRVENLKDFFNSIYSRVSNMVEITPSKESIKSKNIKSEKSNSREIDSQKTDEVGRASPLKNLNKTQLYDLDRSVEMAILFLESRQLKEGIEFMTEKLNVLKSELKDSDIEEILALRKWLDSAKARYIFDNLFVKFNKTVEDFLTTLK